MKYISNELNVFSVAKGKKTALMPVSRHIVQRAVVLIHDLCKLSQQKNKMQSCLDLKSWNRAGKKAKQCFPIKSNSNRVAKIFVYNSSLWVML